MYKSTTDEFLEECSQTLLEPTFSPSSKKASQRGYLVTPILPILMFIQTSSIHFPTHRLHPYFDRNILNTQASHLESPVLVNPM